MWDPGRVRTSGRRLRALSLSLAFACAPQIGSLHLERDLQLLNEGDSCRLSVEQEFELRRACGLFEPAADAGDDRDGKPDNEEPIEPQE
eukprot:14780-Prymnesium_polylepis.1